MLERHKKQNLFKDNELVSVGLKWKDVKAQCKDLSLMDKLNYVNKLWNKKRYVHDNVNFKQKDYWQTPYQFSRLGGDCEDYAIAKMFTLQELGVTNDMRLLIVKRGTLDHCVLGVDDGDKTWILDCFNNTIREHKDYSCTLVNSINTSGMWVHITPRTNIA